MKLSLYITFRFPKISKVFSSIYVNNIKENYSILAITSKVRETWKGLLLNRETGNIYTRSKGRTIHKLLEYHFSFLS